MDKVLKLDLRIPPQWARIERVRVAVSTCVSAVFADTDLEDALAMTCAELIENAIKYGHPSADRVQLTLFDRPDHVVVEVVNTPASDASVAALRSRIEWIASFPTAQDAYFAAIAAVSEKPEGDTGSGLGLVRIAYEGGCKLSCELRDELLVTRADHLFGGPRSTTG
ncbi:MAG: sensor histidine kinase [Polyangiaceae bacterium]|nr:sensor histidine kinase [Polyangiaceae bacterium]